MAVLHGFSHYDYNRVVSLPHWKLHHIAMETTPDNQLSVGRAQLSGLATTFSIYVQVDVHIHTAFIFSP